MMVYQINHFNYYNMSILQSDNDMTMRNVVIAYRELHNILISTTNAKCTPRRNEDGLLKTTKYIENSTSTMILVTMQCLPDDDHVPDTPPNEDDDHVPETSQNEDANVIHEKKKQHLAEACRR